MAHCPFKGSNWNLYGKYYSIAEIDDWTEDEKMRIQVSGQYRTRDGRRVSIITDCGRGDYPMLGYIDKRNDGLHHWTREGRAHLNNGRALDLVAELGAPPDVGAAASGLCAPPNVWAAASGLGESTESTSDSGSGGGGRKYDAGKADLSIIPLAALEAEARVFQFGEAKYARYNYREGGISTTRLASACIRHVFQWLWTRSTDSESGLHHLGHARACLAMILDLEALGISNDTRDLARMRGEE